MKLYYSKGSCSLASHIMLEEAGARFDAHRINLQEGDQRKPEYQGVNPKGKVPALLLDGGEVLTENPAIISYVADTHPQAGLLAAPGQLARARAQEWLAWCASSIHPPFSAVFAAAKNKVEPDASVRQAIQSNLDLFDRWLAGKRFVLGDFSAADAYTLVFSLWAKRFQFKLGEHMVGSAKALLERPGVKRAVATQELRFDL